MHVQKSIFPPDNNFKCFNKKYKNREKFQAPVVFVCLNRLTDNDAMFIKKLQPGAREERGRGEGRQKDEQSHLPKTRIIDYCLLQLCSFKV